MRAVSALAALLLLGPLNLLFVLAGLMFLVEIASGPQRAVATGLFCGLVLAFVPVFALNTLARSFVVKGVPGLVRVRIFWWGCAALFLLPVVLALAYALYRLVGGSPYVPICAPAECPFGPGSSDALFLGFLAVPFAVPVIHLWLLRTRGMRSNISLQADRER